MNGRTIRGLAVSLPAGHSEKTIIELAGAAGCGKSFVMQKLRDVEGAQPYTPRIKPADYIFLLAIFPAMLLIRRDWGVIFRIAARHVLLFRSLARETSGVFVVDEGPWHLLFESYAPRARRLPKSVLLSACRPFMHVDGPGHVFFLRASPETVRARRLARSRQRERTTDLDAIIEDGLGKEAWIAFLENRLIGKVVVRKFNNDSDEGWQSVVLHAMRLAELPASDERRRETAAGIGHMQSPAE